jgi:hypothetical protein
MKTEEKKAREYQVQNIDMGAFIHKANCALIELMGEGNPDLSAKEVMIRMWTEDVTKKLAIDLLRDKVKELGSLEAAKAEGNVPENLTEEMLTDWREEIEEDDTGKMKDTEWMGAIAMYLALRFDQDARANFMHFDDTLEAYKDAHPEEQVA